MAPAPRRPGPSWSCGEAKVDDVPVLNDVVLAFETHFAVVAARGHRPARDEMVVADDLGADEAALDVTVNLAGGELRRGVAWDRPGAALVFADGEERDVAEQIVAGANHPVEPRLGEAEIGQERRGVGSVELRDLELDLGADRGSRGFRAGEKRRQAGRRGRAIDRS